MRSEADSGTHKHTPQVCVRDLQIEREGMKEMAYHHASGRIRTTAGPAAADHLSRERQSRYRR